MWVIMCVLCLQECQGRPSGSGISGGPGIIAMPTAALSSSSHQQQQLQHHEEQQHYQQQQQQYGDYDEDVPAVTFKMLMKKGGRDDRTKELHVSWAC